ncbi:MAG: hypothetical protein ACTHVE_06370 [Senegalia sp. (in: firmicutes)]|uniref:hypothetical protein n=1 Tax=Senegalia sp. (in: firmicutes) TaxID=1924098 RepID=UPI003F9BD31E
MILNIIITLITITLLIISIFSFLQKGPIISIIYYFSTQEERKELRIKDRYYYIGTVFLMSSILFGTILIEETFNLPIIRTIRIPFIIILCIYTIFRYAQIESKRMKAKNKK